MALSLNLLLLSNRAPLVIKQDHYGHNIVLLGQFKRIKDRLISKLTRDDRTNYGTARYFEKESSNYSFKKTKQTTLTESTKLNHRTQPNTN